MAIYVDDKELVAAHQAGDSEAFEELVREYRSALFTHGRRKLYCDAAAEDAVQETLVRAYRALPKFNGEYRLGPWLHRIMANVCVDEINRRRRDGEKVDRVAAQPAYEFDVPGVEEELGLSFDGSDVNKALSELPDSYSEALTLRFVDELGYDKVAEIAGVSEQNARARVSRARVIMKAALKGVAVLPVLLFGVLRRGEKAAAAASASGVATTSLGSPSSGVSAALPALVETASATAPTAMPVIAKAAVGIGLAASVLAPTSDSAVHRAVGDFVSGEETALIADGMVLGSTSDEGSVEGADASNGFVLGETLSPSVSVEFDTIEQQGAMEPEITGNSLSRITEVIAGQLISRSVGLGEYQLGGPVELVTAGSAVSGKLEQGSRIEVSTERDPEGRYRIDGLLMINGNDSLSLEIRIAGFLSEKSEEARVGGLFRAVGSGEQFAERGAFDGRLKLGLDGQEGSLALRFSP